MIIVLVFAAIFLIVFFNSYIFNRYYIVQKVELNIPKSADIVNIEKGDPFFAHILLQASDYQMLISQLNNEKNLVDTTRIPPPRNLEKYCEWWDVELSAVKSTYLFFGKGKPGYFHAKEVWLFTIPERETDMTSVYFYVIE